MKAIEVARFGGPEVLQLREVPDPDVAAAAGSGTVLLDVAAADTLWLETMVRSGGGGAYFPVTLPYRPGVGVAGVVAVTPGVPGASGRRVLARLGHDGGGYATRVA